MTRVDPRRTTVLARDTRPPIGGNRACGRARPGIALLVVLLALLTVETAVTAALFIATQDRVAGHAAVQRERARLAAESAVALSIARWDAASAASVPILTPTLAASGPAPLGGRLDAYIERLAGSAFRIVATATIDGASGIAASASAAALVAAILPQRLAAEFPAAISTGGNVSLGPTATIVGAAAVAACPPPADSLLATSLALPAPALQLPPAAVVSMSAGALVTGAPPIRRTVVGTDSAALHTLAGLAVDTLAALADRIEAGSIDLAPAAVGGSCDIAAPANWGAPAGGGPCAGYAPLVHAPGDLTIAGGAGQGVLLVAGDLVIDSAASFDGAVVVLGNADIRGSIVGALRVAGDVRVDGVARHEPCAVWRAALGSPALRRPYRKRRWRLAVP